MNTEAAAEKLVGRKVLDVEGTWIYLDDGNVLGCQLEADCCSRSDFTDEGQFQELRGTTILGVEDRSGKSSNNPKDPEDADCLSWHFLVFRTSGGHVTVDWRNDSNGYYDGSVDWEEK